MSIQSPERRLQEFDLAKEKEALCALAAMSKNSKRFPSAGKFFRGQIGLVMELEKEARRAQPQELSSDPPHVPASDEPAAEAVIPATPQPEESEPAIPAEILPLPATPSLKEMIDASIREKRKSIHSLDDLIRKFNPRTPEQQQTFDRMLLEFLPPSTR